MPLTKDGNKTVRKAAIIGLGLLESPKALPYLSQILRDRSTQIIERAYGAVALGLIGDKKATGLLIDILRRGRGIREIDGGRALRDRPYRR